MSQLAPTLAPIEAMENATAAPWLPHPKFPGVAMKSLIGRDIPTGA